MTYLRLTQHYDRLTYYIHVTYLRVLYIACVTYACVIYSVCEKDGHNGVQAAVN